MIYEHEHVKTPETSEQVKRMMIAGAPLNLIAISLNISRKTLQKHYEYEIEMSEVIAVTEVSSYLLANCRMGKEKSIFFYLQTKGKKYGWGLGDKDEKEEEFREIIKRYAETMGLLKKENKRKDDKENEQD